MNFNPKFAITRSAHVRVTAMNLASNGVFKVAQFNGLAEINQKTEPCCHGNENLGILTQNFYNSAYITVMDNDRASSISFQGRAI